MRNTDWDFTAEDRADYGKYIKDMVSEFVDDAHDFSLAKMRNRCYNSKQNLAQTMRRMLIERDAIMRKLDARGKDTEVYFDSGKDSAFYDDGFVHVVRNHWRYAVTVRETSSDSFMDRLTAGIVKIIDA